MSRRFWLPIGHATEIAQHQLTQFGWTLGEDAGWRLSWTLDSPPPEVFDEAARGRWMNHVQGNGALTLKNHLCMSLRNADARATAAGVVGLYDFAPQTFLLPTEWHEWMRARAWDPDAIWIQKPADASRGRGVALITDPSEVRNGNLVVQRYIANPHLIDGFKYSLRLYVLIVSVDPLIVYVFGDGFTKLASRPFSLAAEDRADRFRHLTNPDVLRDDPQAGGVSARNTTHREFRRRLRNSGIDDELLWSRMRRLLAATVAAAQPFMRAAQQGTGGRGQFELLGVDVAVDDHLKPFLIECNLSPSLSVEASLDTDASRDEAAIKTQVVHDTLRLVGADTEEEPLPVPLDGAAARERVAWHDSRRGGFERLWPSPAALACVAGAEPGALDLALLGTETPPALAVNRVSTVMCGTEALVVDTLHDRVSLLDLSEARAWVQVANGDGPPAPHLVEWLQAGWLAPADLADTARPARMPDWVLQPRVLNGWNRERIYAFGGCRVAVVCATPQLEAVVERALAWWHVDDADRVDATIVVRRRADIAGVLAQIQRLGLTREGGIVRRTLWVTVQAGRCVLSVGPVDGATPRVVTIGGDPIGAWIDGPQGRERLDIAGFTGSGSPANLVLDLVTDGPGVVRALDPTTLLRLAKLGSVPDF